MAKQSKINKQGRDNILSAEESDKLLKLLIDDAERCYSHYQEMLNEDEHGNVINEENPSLARELARMNLTLNYYTEWYWKTNLHNLFHFLSLRADSHAQYEIRTYAETMLDIVKEWVPFAYEAFMEYRVKGMSFSGNALKAIKAMVKGEKVTFENSGMSKREWNEFTSALELEIN